MWGCSERNATALHESTDRRHCPKPKSNCPRGVNGHLTASENNNAAYQHMNRRTLNLDAHFGVRLFHFMLLASIVAIVTPGCVIKQASQGVDNLWREPDTPTFQVGQTTQRQVMNTLGPPSQVISLGNQTVFYYLLEQRKGRKVVLVVFNASQEKIIYDRAIFFFDAQGKLSQFATSHENIPRK
jgi:outer membrane protein assembly factor BamE (lipoprotein component of BamABCDE complex)